MNLKPGHPLVEPFSVPRHVRGDFSFSPQDVEEPKDFWRIFLTMVKPLHFSS